MKVFLLVVGLIVATCEACEEHRRIAARLRAQQEQAEARLRTLAAEQLRREQDLARSKVKDAIYRSRWQASGYQAAPLETSRIRSVQPTSYQYRSVLPIGSHFCNESDTYYCLRDARCEIDAITGDWRCITEKVVLPHYTRSRAPTGGRRFYPIHPTWRRPTVQSKLECNPGYRLKADNSSCIDIDECVEEEPCDSTTATCKNYRGGYYCSCLKGYTRDRASRGCVDRDECTAWPKACGIATCVNSVGSYNCECPAGYSKGVQKICEDINECDSNPCSGNATCFNLWGGYRCDLPHECPDNYKKQTSRTTAKDVCFLTLPGQDSNLPNVITYQKILVPAKDRADYFLPLGGMTFRSNDLDYYHRFEVEILEGEENFRIERMYSPLNVLKINFFNLIPLHVGDELPLLIKITNIGTPKGPRRYHYDSRLHKYVADRQESSVTQEMSMTIIPGIRGQ